MKVKVKILPMLHIIDKKAEPEIASLYRESANQSAFQNTAGYLHFYVLHYSDTIAIFTT